MHQQKHDWFTATLTFGLCCGLIISYLPQHARIIRAGSSEGFSPWFLLLGSTSSAAGMLNMFTMQFGIVKCCRYFSLGGCLEMTAGIVQVGLQWAMFTFIFVLYMLYYPPHLKYITPASDPETSSNTKPLKRPQRTEEWQNSVILAWVTFGHFAIIVITTIYLLLTTSPSPVPNQPLPPRLSSWATLLGVSSAMLAAIQYMPQIIHTYRMKLVGALSIAMMMIQSPGAVLMVLSIALRPDTNWTSWITFAVAGIMQGTLLVMCITWKFRQLKLGIDDFGAPLPPSAYTARRRRRRRNSSSSRPSSFTRAESDLSVPGLQVDEEEEPQAVRAALAAAIESAVGEDIVGSAMRAASWPGAGESPAGGLGTSAGERAGDLVAEAARAGSMDGTRAASMDATGARSMDGVRAGSVEGSRAGSLDKGASETTPLLSGGGDAGHDAGAESGDAGKDKGKGTQHAWGGWFGRGK